LEETMTNAALALNSPVRPATSFSFLINSAICRPVEASAEVRQAAPASAETIDPEERRWQLEWERRNIED
jgi:hypothetical protein